MLRAVTHNYFFGRWPEMPWKEKDALESLQERKQVVRAPFGKREEGTEGEVPPNGRTGEAPYESAVRE